MPELSITDTRADLATVINRVAFGHERVILTHRGKKLAAVFPGCWNGWARDACSS
jgi:prevent-host-death family protein